jgi:hypothetical protein
MDTYKFKFSINIFHKENGYFLYEIVTEGVDHEEAQNKVEYLLGTHVYDIIQIKKLKNYTKKSN